MSSSRTFYDPFFSLSDFDRLFNDAFNARALHPSRGSQNDEVARQDAAPRAMRPRIDVHEDAASNTVTATFELPGLAKEDVNIDVHNNVLTVSGESKIASDRDENGYAVRERRYGRFARSIPLPPGIKSEDIKAGLENGVLTVSFPKTTPEQAPKKISIA